MGWGKVRCWRALFPADDVRRGEHAGNCRRGGRTSLWLRELGRRHVWRAYRLLSWNIPNGEIDSLTSSLAALRQCVALGADVMETDVRRSRDGYLVIMHDDTVLGEVTAALSRIKV